MEVVASLSQGRTAAAQCGLFTHKLVSVIFEPPCTSVDPIAWCCISDQLNLPLINCLLPFAPTRVSWYQTLHFWLRTQSPFLSTDFKCSCLRSNDHTPHLSLAIFFFNSEPPFRFRTSEITLTTDCPFCYCWRKAFFFISGFFRILIGDKVPNTHKKKL